MRDLDEPNFDHDSEVQEELWNEHKAGALSGLYFAFPLGVCGCELTIRWNHITGVGSINASGQLIPLVLAAGQLLHLIFMVTCVYPYRSWLERERGRERQQRIDSATETRKFTFYGAYIRADNAVKTKPNLRAITRLRKSNAKTRLRLKYVVSTVVY